MAEINTSLIPNEYHLHNLFDYKKVKTFLSKNEPFGVNLSSHYALPSLWPLSTFLILASRKEELSGVTFFHSGGLVLCAGESVPDKDHLDEKLLALCSLFSSRFHTMIGEPKQLFRIKTLFPELQFRDVDYIFMAKDSSGLQYETPEMKCRPAKITDFPQLVELQCEYEIEEVILNPSRFSRSVCEQSVRTALAKHMIYVTEYKGKIIAKAQTNAIGFRYCQLGGIYTKKAFRHIGAGSLAVTSLCSAIESKKKEACLFVKPGNEAAVGLYKNLGFVEKRPFRISYDKAKI